MVKKIGKTDKQIQDEWNVIWKRLSDQYPESYELIQKFRETSYDMWKKISPKWGEFIDGKFIIGKDNKLKGTEPFYLSLGAFIEVLLEKIRKEQKDELFKALKKYVPGVSLPKFCPKCEIENDENAKYCDQCGKELPTNEVEND